MFHRPTEQPHGNRKDWLNIKRLFPYIWDFKGRVIIALACLILSKVAIVGMPLVLKEIVDTLDRGQIGDQVMMLPLVLLLMYGGLRLVSSLFNELRDAIFARVRYHAMRVISQRVLRHLYTLSLGFHLDRL